MCKFKDGQKVVFISNNHDVKRGTIINVFEKCRIALVEMDDGSRESVLFSKMGIDVENVSQEEKTNKQVEKSEITITPDEFKNIAKDVVIESVKDINGGPMLGIVFAVFVAKLHTALFCETVE